MHKSELKLKQTLEQLGYKVYRAGCPDFMVITPDNKLEFVEVKIKSKVVN